ncbi:LAMI_0F11166g1_1 [Lachancea mirantina]|uniref:LAMI_0F11166g1_1 n=1 Tax=Lachancea mirantina TaxID=1230905 RepID=A0A1G4K2K7_9SACH|nr:LAMI_0F11166g1_1 [Lachancea mirantina]
MPGQTTHCRAFYDAITQFSSTIRLQVVPDDFRDTSCANSNFLFVNSCNEIEIICFKTTFLKLFNEAHLYFNAFKSERNYPLNQESYLASVALLFTSPENRSALNCHDIIISKVLETEREAYTDYWSIPSIFLQKEFLFLRALLTCSLNRINKSSSLWLLLRKIYVIYKERFSILNLDFQSVFQRSAEQHFSNYYCWNTVRWFYDVEGIESKLALLNQTKEFSFKHIKDVSAWSALAYMACRTHSREEFHDSEYRRLGSHFQVEIQRNGFKNDTSLLPKRLSLIEEIKTYIELAEVREWPPYFCLWCLMSLEGKNKVLDIFEDWYNQLLDFERIYGRVTAIESVGNQPQVQDTISHTLIEVMSNKKKLLQKLNINF